VKKVERHDRAIAEKVAVEEQSTKGRWIGQFAELGDQPPMQILSGAVVAAGAMRGDRKLLRAGLRMLGAHSIATLAKAFVKDNVDRTRPGEAIDHRNYRLAPGRSDEHRLQSMPSGHSAGVVAVAAGAIADYPGVSAPAAAGAAALVAAQLPSRNHYLSDVAVGSAIGLIAFGLMRLVLPPLAPNGAASPRPRHLT
jgi:membrane-associated phospholipid phosphatase